jgi:hypothetical protein
MRMRVALSNGSTLSKIAGYHASWSFASISANFALLLDWTERVRNVCLITIFELNVIDK